MSTLPPVTDPQDPLPEGSWGWRRLIVFLATAATYALLGWAIFKAPASDMEKIAANLMLLLGGILTLYLVAPSANQITELLATLKLRLRGPRLDNAKAAPTPEEPTPSISAKPPWERGQ